MVCNVDFTMKTSYLPRSLLYLTELSNNKMLRYIYIKAIERKACLRYHIRVLPTNLENQVPKNHKKFHF